MARDAREYDNVNRGALFKNASRRGDRSPDYTGKLNIEGTEFRMSAWLQAAKDGSKYLSIAVRAQDSEAREASRARPSDDPRDREIEP